MNVYTIGPETIKRVFDAHGLDYHIFDMQQALDAVEIALTTPSIKEAAKTLLTPDEKGRRKAVFEACESMVKVYKFDAVLRKLADG